VRLRTSLIGAGHLAARLRALGARADAAATPALLAGGDEVAAEAARRAPRRSGTLAGSLRVVAGPDGVAVEAAAPYAVAAELGSVRRPARPFLGPGLRARRAAIVAGLAAAFRRALR
jgi:hypothetical protein